MNAVIEGLEEVFRRVLDLSRRLTFDRRDTQQIYAACLHGILLERLSAVLLLLKHTETGAIPAILRELFDTYVDLVNLVRCPEYIVRLRASSLKQRQAARVITEADDAAALVDLERLGLGELKGRARFERAGLATVHDALHALLARRSHRNLEQHPGRLLHEIEGQYRLHGTGAGEPEALMPFVHMLAGMAVDSYRRLAQLTQRRDAQGLAQVAEVLKRYVSNATRAQAA